jgi:hypothetical protein
MRPRGKVAEREGFEPSGRLPVHVISSHADSAALASLRMSIASSPGSRRLAGPMDGGERGIRTPGAVACPTVFETAPFDRSGISPLHSIRFVFPHTRKEAFQELTTLGVEHASIYGKLPVQIFQPSEVRGSPTRATASVGGTIDDSRYPCPEHRSHTHHAWLHSHIERCTFQPPVPHRVRCSADSYDFGVSCRILQTLHAVIPPPYDPALVHKHGPDRNLTGLESLSGLLDSLGHPECVATQIHDQSKIAGNPMGVKRQGSGRHGGHAL